MLKEEVFYVLNPSPTFPFQLSILQAPSKLSCAAESAAHLPFPISKRFLGWLNERQHVPAPG